MAEHLVLYDGTCGFCDRAVRFVLAHDKRRRFRFAPLQSEFAKQAAARHGHDASKLDTMCLILHEGQPGERALVKGRAVARMLRELGGAWVLVSALGAFPTFLLDLGYTMLAGKRYRIFGRLDACRVPDPEVRDRYVGL